MKILKFIASLIWIISDYSAADIYRIEAKENNRFWSFGIGLEQQSYGSDQFPIRGLSQVTSLGYGKIDDLYFWKTGAFLSSGPMDQVFYEKLIIDASSKGLMFQYGPSLFSKEMRGGIASGPLAGLRLTDFTSKTIGSRLEITDSKRRNLSLAAQYTSLNLELGVFFCQAKPSRPIGNRPDLLITRIEAWNIQISTIFPLMSKFAGELETTDDPAFFKTNRSLINNKSSLKGFSVLMNFDTWLGG